MASEEAGRVKRPREDTTPGDEQPPPPPPHATILIDSSPSGSDDGGDEARHRPAHPPSSSTGPKHSAKRDRSGSASGVGKTRCTTSGVAGRTSSPGDGNAEEVPVDPAENSNGFNVSVFQEGLREYAQNQWTPVARRTNTVGAALAASQLQEQEERRFRGLLANYADQLDPPSGSGSPAPPSADDASSDGDVLA